MPKIQFVKNIPTIDVECGANLMQALLAAGLPVASSCNGDGVCSKCRIKILSGGENISKIGALEQTLRDRNRIASGIRIACQSEVLGDITVDTDYW
jgi:2Fe-2S ferredoxin